MISNDNGSVKEPMDGSTDMAAVKKRIMAGIVYRTAAVAAFIAFAWLVFSRSFILVPAISAAMILYADSVIGLLLTGKISKPISSSLKALAVTVFIAILVTYQDQFPALRSLGLPVFLIGALWSLHYLSKAYSELTGVVTRALLIASVGSLYYSVFTAIDMPVLSRLGLVALVGLVSASVFSLLGVLKKHSDVRVSYIGNMFARLESPIIVCMAVAGIMTYILFIRQSLTVLGTFGLTVIEWAAVSAVILFLALKIKAILPVDGEQKFGDARKVAGSLTYDPGELKNAAEKVESFIREGKKDGLVALVAAALASNDVPVDGIQSVLTIVIDHEDEKEPPAVFAWAVGNVREANRRKRLKTIDEVMSATTSAIDGARYPGEKHMAATSGERSAAQAVD